MLTNQDCYWAGFLAADGCVDSEGRIRIYLHIKDIAQLEKFKSYTGKPHKISTSAKYPDRCSFEFTDRVMIKWLEDNFNIVPNKSLIYKVPDNLTKEQYSHFFRGLFDGDGCICESFSNVNSRLATLYASLVGSDDCVKFFSDFNKAELNITGSLQNRGKYTKTGNSFSNIKYSTNKAKVLLKFMYESSTPETRLDRKYDLYVKTVVENNRLTR